MDDIKGMKLISSNVFDIFDNVIHFTSYVVM